MTTYSKGRQGKAWVAVRAQVFAEEQECWLCGGYVDQDLPHRHRMARSADHLVQLKHGGAPTDRRNARLAHMACNSRRSAQIKSVTPDRCACVIGQPCGVIEAVSKAQGNDGRCECWRRQYECRDPSDVEIHRSPLRSRDW